MRINRGLLNWGVFLIALGGIPLAVQQGFTDSGIAGDLLRLWPLILVGLGLGMLLRWTPLAWLGGALVAGTIGIIFGALIAGNLTGISVACGEEPEEPVRTSRSSAASSSEFRVDLTLSCGSLDLSRDEPSRWSVEATHTEDRAPVVEGDSSALSITQDDDDTALIVFGTAGSSSWDVSIPNDAVSAIDATINAGNGGIDLGGGPLGAVDAVFNLSTATLDMADSTTPETVRMDIETNASSATLLIPPGTVVATVDANFSSVTICVPSAAQLRVELDSIFSADDLGSAGLELSGEGWQTPGYEIADARVDLTVNGVFSSLTFQRPEVCT